jgi:hypothetical protein
MLELNLGLPTKNTVERLYDEIAYQRAVQAYLWCERNRTIWKEERGQA